MKYLFFFIFFIIFCNSYNAQNRYQPKDNVRKLSYSKFPILLKRAIKLDSNFADSYLGMAKFKHSKGKYLSERGAIYYYCKFFEKYKLFPTRNSYETDYTEKQRINRVKAVLSAYQLNPEYFISDNQLSDFTSSDLYKIVNDCVNDCDQYYSSLSEETYNIYTLKAELDLVKKDYTNFTKSYKVLLEKVNLLYSKYDSDDYKLKIYDKLYTNYIIIGDSLSAFKSVNEYLKVYSQSQYKTNISSDVKNKQQQLVTLVNKINNLSSNNFEICSKDGKDVFCKNKNIFIENYSSAIKFWNYYFFENSFLLNEFQNYYKKADWKNQYGIDVFNINAIPLIYKYYIDFGKELGMIWPKFGPQILHEEYFNNLDIKNLIRTDLSSFMIYDINESKMQIIFGDFEKSSDSVAFINIPNNWNDYMNVEIVFKDGNNNQYFKRRNGNLLPAKFSFPKLYNIEKQNYEKEQALLRAQHQQQEVEAKRLQQENYIAEQNRLALIRQQELEQDRLAEVERKRLEVEKLQNAKLTKAIVDAFNNSNKQSKKENTSTNTAHTCEWCSRTFKGIGFDYEMEFQACKGHKHYPSPLYNSHGEFCSEKCAVESCESKH